MDILEQENGNERLNLSQKQINQKKFIDDFLDDKIKDRDSKHIFLDQIFGGNNSIDLKNELNSFKEKNGNSNILNAKGKKTNKYEGVNMDSLINDLKNHLSEDYIVLQNERKSLKNIFFNDFDFTEKQYNSSVLPEISKKTASDFLDLIKSPKKRKDFLDSILGKENVPNSKETVSFFDKIPSLVNKLSVLNQENQDKLINILQRLDSRDRLLDLGEMDRGALKDLLSSDFLDRSTKKEIIKEYLPVISLKDARDANLNFNENIQKEGIIRETFSEEEINEIGLAKLIDGLKEEYIYLETDKLLSDENVEKISKNNILGNKIILNYSEHFNISLDIVIENIKKNGPQTLEQGIYELNKENENGRFNNLNKFSEGNILKISKIEENGVKISYIKIQKIDDEKKELKILNIGDNLDIDLERNTEGENINYLQFFNIFKNEDVKLDIFTKEDIEEKIKSGKIKNVKNEYISINLESLDDNDFKEDIKEKNKARLEKIIEEKERKLNIEEDNYDINSDEYADLRDYKNQLKNIGDIENKDLIILNNKLEFINLINEIDINGKNIDFKKGTFFKTEKGVYEITGIDYENETIELKSQEGYEKDIPFYLFIETFKKNKAERIEPILDFGFLIKKLKGKNTLWDKHEVINGKLIKQGEKDKSNNGEQIVDYLISEDNDEIIKVKNISGNKVTVVFGERKDITSLKGEESKKYKGKEGEVLFLEDKEYILTLNELEEYISEKKLYPDWETGKEKKEEEYLNSKDERKSSLKTKFFDGISINEFLEGGKMILDSVEESLKKGNEIHSARVATALGKFLPGELSADLKIKIERAESEQTDKELVDLGKVDSKDAIDRIAKWLNDKNTPDHKLEAGILFIVSKYGVLYAKGGLKNSHGKFLWYKAFGGKVGDTLFNKVKNDCEKDKIPFTEEILMSSLLKDQSKTHKYSNKIRRSRLYKEYDAKLENGTSSELEKGSKEAKDMRTYDSRNNSAIDEGQGGEFNISIGKYKEAVNRSSTLDNLNELPFIYLFSGAGKLLQEKQLNEFKNFTGSGLGGLIFTRFLGDTPSMDIFNKTILSLSKKFGEKDPNKFSKMYGRAKIIFDNQNNSGISLEKKMKEAQDFWSEYGKPLTRTMLNLNNQDSTYSRTDKILLEHKDEFSLYNNTFKAFVEGDAVFKNEEYMGDQFSKQGVSGFGFKVLDDIGDISTEGKFRNKDAALDIWEEIIGEIIGTKSKVYSDDPIINKRLQLESIDKQLSTLFAFLKDRELQDKLLDNLKKGKGIGVDLKRLNITKYIKGDFSKFKRKELLDLDPNSGSSAFNFIRNISEEILSNTIDDYNNDDKIYNSVIDDLIDTASNQANNALYNNK